MTPSPVIKTIRERAIAKTLRERKQLALIPEDDLHKHTVWSKIRHLWDDKQAENFAKCGRVQIYRTCKGCRDRRIFLWRCNLKWCPRCQWRVTAGRKKMLLEFAREIAQPKHLVLTQRNFATLTRKKIREHQRNLAAFRRLKCFAPVKGGCCSVEITHEGNGWHLHSHWLIDARWLDMQAVSEAWAKLVGQEFAICKVMDAREKNYVQELCKYVVEGSELAGWDAELIHQFVRAVKGCRFFFSFGSLLKAAPGIRAFLEAQKEPAKPCDCGCDRFEFRDPANAPSESEKRRKEIGRLLSLAGPEKNTCTNKTPLKYSRPKSSWLHTAGLRD